MNNGERCASSASDQAIEDGETYDHAEHGYVEVTGIWHRTQRLDTTRDADEQDLIVVRYVPGEEGTWLDELAQSLDDFRDAIG